MPFLLGAISGVLLTVLAVFAADAVTTAADPSKDPQQRIVNLHLLGVSGLLLRSLREGQVDELVLREIRVDHNIEQAALVVVLDLGDA